MEGVSALIGFQGPDQPPLGPFLYPVQAQAPTSALGPSVPAPVRQIRVFNKMNIELNLQLRNTLLGFIIFLFLSLQWSQQDLKDTQEF